MLVVSTSDAAITQHLRTFRRRRLVEMTVIRGWESSSDQVSVHSSTSVCSRGPSLVLLNQSYSCLRQSLVPRPPPLGSFSITSSLYSPTISQDDSTSSATRLSEGQPLFAHSFTVRFAQTRLPHPTMNSHSPIHCPLTPSMACASLRITQPFRRRRKRQHGLPWCHHLRSQ